MDKKDKKNEILQDFLTIKQACKRLDISEFTLRKHLRDGKLKGYKKFGKWFVFADDITKYLKSE